MATQVSTEKKRGLEAKRMSIECHPECMPGQVWPLWCFAEEVSKTYYDYE